MGYAGILDQADPDKQTHRQTDTIPTFSQEEKKGLNGLKLKKNVYFCFLFLVTFWLTLGRFIQFPLISHTIGESEEIGLFFVADQQVWSLYHYP